MKKESLLFNRPNEVYELLKNIKSSEYIDTMKLTTKFIEEFCKSQSLNVRQRTNDSDVENKLNPPLMASFYYYYLYFYQKIPSQIQFQEFYKEMNRKWMDKKVPIEKREGFNSRLARFYASITRELHFYHLVKESNQFDLVSYTLEDDIKLELPPPSL